jgi:hypothetical protein
MVVFGWAFGCDIGVLEEFVGYEFPGLVIDVLFVVVDLRVDPLVEGVEAFLEVLGGGVGGLRVAEGVIVLGAEYVGFHHLSETREGGLPGGGAPFIAQYRRKTNLFTHCRWLL